MAVGVRRLSIDELCPEINNALIIGVIIAKQPLRRFVSKKDGTERGVWNFTLRDSPSDTINSTWWGTADGAMTYSLMFSIGDVVEITNPRVKFVHPGDSGAQFRPQVSSPFELELQENRSEMIPHVEEDTAFIAELTRIPTKPPGDYLRLSDLCNYGRSMLGEFVNLLVVVVRVNPVRTILSRRSRVNMLCRDIVLLDTSERDFLITVWSEDILHMADVWKPRHTADMKVDFNAFRQSVTAAVCSCTVVTVDPNIPEASDLRKYVQSIPAQSTALLDQISDTLHGDSFSSTVMTSAQVLDKAYSGDVPGGQFSALLFAHVTNLDLDGPYRVFNFKCVNCGGIVVEETPCPSPQCLEHPAPQHPVFSLRVDLTDHRGSLTGCRLTGPRAASVLGCKEDEFMALSSEERTERKWRLLLQRCEARIMVLCVSTGRPHPLISLLSCTPADPALVSAKLPIY